MIYIYEVTYKYRNAGENHFEKGHSSLKLWLKNWFKLLFFGLWPMVHMYIAKPQFFFNSLIGPLEFK